MDPVVTYVNNEVRVFFNDNVSEEMLEYRKRNWIIIGLICQESHKHEVTELLQIRQFGWNLLLVLPHHFIQKLLLALILDIDIWFSHAGANEIGSQIGFDTPDLIN